MAGWQGVVTVGEHLHHLLACRCLVAGLSLDVFCVLSSVRSRCVVVALAVQKLFDCCLKAQSVISKNLLKLLNDSYLTFYRPLDATTM